MPATIIDGKALAERVRARVKTGVVDLAEQKLTPGLAVVLVGEDPASAIYVRNKGAAAKECGVQVFDHKLPADTSQTDLLELVARLNLPQGRATAAPRLNQGVRGMPVAAGVPAN